MELTGRIVAVQPVQTGEGRNGTWKKQEYVVEYDRQAQYPRKMMFVLWGDKIDQYNIQEGQELKIHFDIDCRAYNGRWYNDIRAWKVEPDMEAAPAVPSEPAGRFADNVPPPPPELLASSSDASSDLPF